MTAAGKPEIQAVNHDSLRHQRNKCQHIYDVGVQGTMLNMRATDTPVGEVVAFLHGFLSQVHLLVSSSDASCTSFLEHWGTGPHRFPKGLLLYLLPQRKSHV